MHFSIAIATSILAASALAAPSRRGADRYQARQARRALNRQGKPVDRILHSVNANISEVSYSSNWAGAIVASPPSGESWEIVSARITVPTPSGSSGDAASAWVGIDGDTCETAILQTGVDFTVDDGYDAWYEWYPDYADDFDLDISAGDVILMKVHATTDKKGVATLTNESTGKTVTKSLTSTSALCLENAEWIVEDFEEGSSLVPFADFGTVTFTDVTATTKEGTANAASGASTIDIESSSDKVLTSVDIVSDTKITVKYK